MLRLMLANSLLALVAANSYASVVTHLPAFNSDGQNPYSNSRVEADTIYAESFLDGFSGWSSQDDTALPSTWHVSMENPVDETPYWWSADASIGGYTNHSLLYLELPAVDLSDTEAPSLSFDLFYALENDTNIYPPFDSWDACHVEVRVAGSPWGILNPETPVYNSQNAFSFSEVFGSQITAGWFGQSDGWVDAICDLSDYRSAATRIRFAFCSDNNFSYSDDNDLIGMLLDNIVIQDGENDPDLVNDGIVDEPGPTVHYSDVASAGDNWILSDNAHSEPWSLLCDISNQDVGIQNSVESSWIVLPANYDLEFDFWMRLDMEDEDGNGDDVLEDYFVIDYAIQGSPWVRLPGQTEIGFYEYYGDETGFGNWYHYVNGAGHGQPTNITFLSGETVKFRFKVITDNNHDGGTGDGLFIDDFQITGETQLSFDAGITQFSVPYPRTMGRPINAWFDVRNFGSEPIEDLNWNLLIDGDLTGVAGMTDIDINDDTRVELEFTPDAADLHYPMVRLEGLDEFSGNDSLYNFNFIVRPENVLELANDYGWNVSSTEFDHLTNTNEELGIGFAQEMRVPELSVDAEYFILDSLNIRFASFNLVSGEIVNWRLKIYSANPAESGELMYENVYQYAPTFSGGLSSADWVNVDVRLAELHVEDGFYIVVETMSESEHQTPGNPSPVPNLTIVPRTWEDVASYSVEDGAMVPLLSYQFNFHAFIHEFYVGIEQAATVPDDSHIVGCWPNPFNPVTTINYMLETAGSVMVQVYDLRGAKVIEIPAGFQNTGSHELSIDGNSLSSGNYFVRLLVNNVVVDTNKIMLLK
jgi:hypothetical protein